MKQIIALLAITFLITHAWAQAGKQVSLEDILVKKVFVQKTAIVNSMNDGIHYTVKEGDKIIKYSYKTGEEEAVIFDLGKIEDSPISSFSEYTFSDDETKILLATNKKPIYRHSFTAEYYYWNSVTKELLPLSEKGAQQIAAFSPDGDRVAFVRDNNLFIKNLKFGTESQVTKDGEKNKIINGAPDWVYEEEFGFNKAFAWSPDSKFLAFIRFDESNVREFDMTVFDAGGSPKDTPALYPHIKTFKYPKAGEENASVSVQVYEIRSKTTIQVDAGEGSSQYIPRISWTPDANDLVVMRLNRRQNQLDVLLANPYTGGSRPLFTEKNNRYIEEDFLNNFTYLDDGKHFVVVSERDGYSHLYLYDLQGFEIKQVTKGVFDVTGFYGYDPRHEIFYYQAAAESPLRREVYYISLDGKKKGKLSTLKGVNSALFSKNYDYYINTFSNTATPKLITLHDRNGKQLRVLEDNSAIKKRVEEFNLPGMAFFTFKTSDGVELNGWMLKPNDFDPNKKYPVVMTQYSGPNSQQVKDEFRVSWNEYLAQQGFIVACVDPRGTAARGEDFRKITYMQLGKYESDDQVEAARYLASLPYVDEDNIAIWGWSFGGFTACLSMEKGGGIFKAGIAVAPVTNWRFYDSIYTERYMRTPQQNPDGYDDNSPITNAGNLKGNLLIIHGSADDNVHLQNTMDFTERLVQEGIRFDMAIYTDRNHNITGGNTTMHLYNRMVDFLKEQLQ